MTPSIAASLYLISGIFFILALRGLSSPETSRKGNLFGILGMLIAIIVTFLLVNILFSSLLLHKSLETDLPRLALSLLIKNFKYKNESFEENRNWKIFSISEITKVQRFLGNHYLSPYRLADIDDDINTGILPKKKL